MRPLGTTVLDGVDLDIEKPYGSQYYADFVDKLTSLWSGGSKHYYLTAVPQCKPSQYHCLHCFHSSVLVHQHQ